MRCAVCGEQGIGAVGHLVVDEEQVLAHRLAFEVVDARARGQPADGHRVDVPRRAEHGELDAQRREA